MIYNVQDLTFEELLDMQELRGVYLGLSPGADRSYELEGNYPGLGWDK